MSPTSHAVSSSPALRCGPACCLDQNLVLVSRHLRFGRDTIKVHRDALWYLRQKIYSKRQRVLAVFAERGGGLLTRGLSARKSAARWDSGQEGPPGRREGRGGLRGDRFEGVLLMTASTSDFWWAVLKTPS